MDPTLLSHTPDSILVQDNDDTDCTHTSSNLSNQPSKTTSSTHMHIPSLQRKLTLNKEHLILQEQDQLHDQCLQQCQYPDIFPSELILHIFKFLATPQDLRSAILVCKLWCSCGIDLLWSRPSLLSLPLAEKMCDTLALARSETLFPYSDYVRRLNFSFLAQDLTDDILVRFDRCKRLERLLLPATTKATEEGLKQILNVGKGLYTLDISEIPAVNDTVLEHVATHCPKLHTLYMTGCTSLTDESVVKLAANCPSLKR
ncbi:SCF ubiquitin ligase complex subunit, partial [Mortierella sp. AM989]